MGRNLTIEERCFRLQQQATRDRAVRYKKPSAKRRRAILNADLDRYISVIAHYVARLHPVAHKDAIAFMQGKIEKIRRLKE